MSSRLDHLRVLLRDGNLDAVIITSSTNRRYLTGFTGADHSPDESSGVALVDADIAVLFTSPTNLPWVQSEVYADIDVRPWDRPWTTSIAAIAKSQRWVRVGFEDRTTTAADYLSLIEELGDGIALVPVGVLVDSLRARKDEEELASLKRALEMTDAAFVAASAQIRAGQSEHEIAEIVRAELRRVGSEGEAFPTIVASGPNAAKPHHSPGPRKIAEGEPIIIDMGAIYRGYNGDLTRTVWIGQPSEQLVTIYEAVAGAHQMAIPLCRAGVSGRDIDLQVREYFSERGLNEYVIHGLGHGLGLRVHESPSAGQASEDIFASGHVVTIEPGLYIPDWGGVRIENVVAITGGAPLDLTSAPIRNIRHQKEQEQ